MANKGQKKQSRVYEVTAASPPKQEQETVVAVRPEHYEDGDVAADGVSDQSTMPTPYAEFGGLQKTAQERKADALSSWEKALAEKKNAREILAAQLRPEDTSKEQRNLRGLAIGQAMGELIESLFGGIYGLRRNGGGYVPRMPAMYSKTLERLNKLRDNDINAGQKYRGLLGNLSLQSAVDAEGAAKERYRDASADDRRASSTQDYIYRQGVSQANKLSQAKFNAELRRQLQAQRHEERIKEQGNAAVLKRPTSGEGLSDEIKYVKSLLLPKTKTTVSIGSKGPVTTTSDATSYSRQADAAAEVLAKKIIPIRKKYGLSDSDIRKLHQVVDGRNVMNVTWDDIEESLDRGVAVEQILDLIH